MMRELYFTTRMVADIPPDGEPDGEPVVVRFQYHKTAFRVQVPPPKKNKSIARAKRMREI